MRNAELYLEIASHYRAAMLKAPDPFSRWHLEILERSYRMVGESETLLERSSGFARTLVQSAPRSAERPQMLLRIVPPAATGPKSGDL
ncbi:hypothetical protein [Bradyrhizobium vignae]|uniref:Uncharacterized protein n=1 Tax=Bradyrhizobium vignae TaxID=1549949 RepID=A0A2U3PU36_9BRAD|nr:hypothetical protein [Bradyrhizobium vignae]SPP92665.1 protein of unknown function [Bradyrhizobium vignae]